MQFLTKIIGPKNSAKLTLMRNPETIRYHDLSVPVSHDQIPEPVKKQLISNNYEVPEINALKGTIFDGDRILELGTGIGVVSGIASKLRDNIVIESYEANPNLIEHIQTLHSINNIKNVQVHNAILTPNPAVESQPFYLHRYFPEASIVKSEFTKGAVDVPVKDFNLVVSEFSPSVLVCDVEGAEAEIFTGANLSGLRAIILEIHPHLISREAVKQIYDSCTAAGLYPVQEHSSALVVVFTRVV